MNARCTSAPTAQVCFGLKWSGNCTLRYEQSCDNNQAAYAVRCITSARASPTAASSAKTLSRKRPSCSLICSRTRSSSFARNATKPSTWNIFWTAIFLACMVLSHTHLNLNSKLKRLTSPTMMLAVTPKQPQTTASRRLIVVHESGNSGRQFFRHNHPPLINAPSVTSSSQITPH